jgi:hypothetical protein
MIQYLEDHPTIAFSPETVGILSAALDDAWQQVEADKPTYKVDGNLARAREVLARHIVEMASHGVLDRQRLVQSALDRLKL